MKTNNQEMKHFAQKFLENIFTGIVITDGNGKVVYIGDSCSDIYGLVKAKYIGKHISFLEKEGTFLPCAGIEVLKTLKKATLVQPDRYGEKLLVTGIPIFNEKGKLEFVITYTSWNVTNYQELRDKYDSTKLALEKYEYELYEHRNRDMRFELVAKSDKMKKILKLVAKISPADISVIIKGAPGTGKGLLAKEIHRKSDRAKGPFLQVSCSAFKNNVLQDELFGYHDKSGGASEKIGLCEMASNGTMLIEDVELLSQDNQKKLLHLIKNGYYFKPGSEKIIKADTRILATTGKDLTYLVAQGKFDKELFYRLNIASINFPSLRERPQDIVPLIDLFLKKCNQKFNKEIQISEQAYSLLACYDWPGNVCELKYLVQKLVLITEENTVQGHHLPSHISPFSSSKFKSEIDLKEYMEFHEGRLVTQAYEKYPTSVGVANYLGISQATAVRKLQKYVADYAAHD
jgi:transcriptional regulator with PAS, ATPase and Fis domain